MEGLISRCKERIVRVMTEYPMWFFVSQITIHMIIVFVLVADGDLISETGTLFYFTIFHDSNAYKLIYDSIQSISVCSIVFFFFEIRRLVFEIRRREYAYHSSLSFNISISLNISQYIYTTPQTIRTGWCPDLLSFKYLMRMSKQRRM